MIMQYLSFLSGDPKIVTDDEEYKKVNFEKFATLRAVFQKEGRLRWQKQAFSVNS